MLPVLAAAAALALFGGRRSASAQELRALSFRSLGGEITLIGDYERNRTALQESASAEITRRIATQRLAFAFEGSVIHPRFLTFGGFTGVNISQGGIRGEGLDFPTRGSDVSYMLSGSLLPRHAVPLHYLASRETTVVLAGQLQGYRLKLLRNSISTNIGRGLPFGLGLGVSSSSRRPDGAGAFIEEDRSQMAANLTLKPVGVLKSTSLRFRRQRTDRPFYNSRLDARTLNGRQVLGFGGSGDSRRNQLEFAADIFDQQGTLPVRNERYSTIGRWRLPASFDLNARWNYTLQETRSEASLLRGVRAEIGHRLYQSLTTRASGEFSRQVTSLLKTSRRSNRLTFRYNKRTALGRLDAGLDLGTLDEDRDAGAFTATVFREELVLTGFDLVFLRQDRVVSGTIAVYDSLGVVRFTEGQDYTIRTVGTRTGIERLATGRIADGERVLVDYEYEIGGSGRIESGTRGWNIGLSIGQGSRVSVRRLTVTQDQRTGELDVLLDPTDTLIAGVTLKLLGVILSTEYENRESRISPYVRREASVGTRIQPEPYTEFGLTIRRLLIDNKRSPFGTDLWGGSLSWSSIPISRVRLQGSLVFESDTGLDLNRRRAMADVRAATRYGQTTLTVTFQYGLDRNGPSSRIRSLGRVELVRSF